MRKLIWTYEKCQEEIKKYKTKSEFKKYSSGAYNKCIKNKWFDLLKDLIGIKPRGYWTHEKCQEEAKKYKTKSEFAKSKGWAYNISLKEGWLDEICGHMVVSGNIKKRCIYAYEFENNHVYIGLTYNIDIRFKKRMLDENDIVNIYIKETGLTPVIKQLTDYINVEEASIKEGEYLNFYKDSNWIILNRSKTGSVGSDIKKWTYENCKIESLKYKTHLEFKIKDNNCLSAIYKNKWNDLLSHLSYNKLPNNYWTKERCIKEGIKYDNRTNFYKNCRGGYAASLKNGWLNDIFDGTRKPR